jgi:hypothetical protein
MAYQNPVVVVLLVADETENERRCDENHGCRENHCRYFLEMVFVQIFKHQVISVQKKIND